MRKVTIPESPLVRSLFGSRNLPDLETAEKVDFDALLLKAYNPDQPRAPAGTSTGGQWVSDENSEAGGEDTSFFDAVTVGSKRRKLKEQVCRRISDRLKDNPEFVGMSDAERANWIGTQIDIWAGTSGDHVPNAIALQLAAQKEFNLTESSTGHYSPETLAEALEKTGFDQKRAFLREMYNETQAQFKEAGIKEVYVARGVMDLPNYPDDLTAMDELNSVSAGVGKTRLAPMSSYSTSYTQAYTFTRGKSKSMILLARVPASSVLSTFRTGFGCAKESEIVVLGGNPEQLLIHDPTVQNYGKTIREIMSTTLKALKTRVKKNWVPGEPQATTDITIEVDANLENADWPKRTPDRMEDLEIAEKVDLSRLSKAEWDESQHPRDNDGKFTDKSMDVGIYTNPVPPVGFRRQKMMPFAGDTKTKEVRDKADRISGGDWKYDLADYSIEDVPKSDIVSTQLHESPDTVENYSRTYREQGEQWKPPLAVRHEGKVYLMGGHHRASAVFHSGGATIRLKIFNNDVSEK